MPAIVVKMERNIDEKIVCKSLFTFFSYLPWI